MQEAVADEAGVGDNSRDDIVALRLGSSSRDGRCSEAMSRRQIQ